MLATLALFALAAGCDLEHPSGQAGCTRAEVDALRMNRIQALGTHNSYKQAISPPEMKLIAAASPRDAIGLDYSHPPLKEQLDLGARQLEIDVLYDPETGRYADPLGPKRAAQAGTPAPPYDTAALKQPGIKTLHAQDVDYRSHCNLFADCLGQIRAWSRAHPDHLPLLILVNLKTGGIKTPGAVTAPEFDETAFAQVDAEIRRVFRPAETISPDRIQGRHATLREAVLTGQAWPTLKAARGKVLFALDAGPGPVGVYRGQRRSLEGRAMFVNTDEASPAAAYLTLNEPLELGPRIKAAVAAGFMVRTRADADTIEARAGDRRRQQAAFASGAQYVSTDYERPDPRFGPYEAHLPGGGVGRLGPR